MSLRRASAGLLALAALLIPATADAGTPPPATLPDCTNQPEMNVIADGFGRMESIGFDSKGRLFFTDSEHGQLLMINKAGGTPKVIADGIDAPGGIIFQRKSGRVLVGFGDSASQAGDGTADPEAGILSVDPKTGDVRTKVEGLQMANGIARGPEKTIFASNDITGGIDRVSGGSVELNWAPVPSANGMIADKAKKTLFVNQTLVASAIQRVPFNDPAGAETYWSAPPGDAAGGLDGLTRNGNNSLFAAANGKGEIWRIDGPTNACVLAVRNPFPNGPSDVAFGRKGAGFSPQSLFFVTFGGELIELPNAR